MKVRKWPVVAALLGGLWVFVRGTPLTAQALVAEYLLGLVVGLLVAYTFRRLYLRQVDLTHALGAIPPGLLYLFLFLKEIVVANLDVAYRVLHPRMPIEPDVIALRLRVENDAAITSIANSITLTPGTLTMDHDPETNTLYVHGIIGRRREAVVAPIRRWEDLLLAVFDEQLAPEDSPPSPSGPPGPAGSEEADGAPAVERPQESVPDPGGDEDGS